MYKSIFLAHLSLGEVKKIDRFADRLFSVVCLSVCPSFCLKTFSYFRFILQNHWSNFNQTRHKASLGVGDSICSNAGSRPSPREDNSNNVKSYWNYFKIFFSRTTRPISTKHGIKYPWVEGIQVCSNEESRPFPRGDNSEIV